jgi:hypothetical protein
MLMISHSLMGFLEVPTSSDFRVDRLAERILEDYRKRSSAINDARRDRNSDNAVSRVDDATATHGGDKR